MQKMEKQPYNGYMSPFHVISFSGVSEFANTEAANVAPLLNVQGLNSFQY